jgi:hypothetical protein
MLWSLAVLDAGARLPDTSPLVALLRRATALVSTHGLMPMGGESGGWKGDDPPLIKYRQLRQGALYAGMFPRDAELKRAAAELDEVLEKTWAACPSSREKDRKGNKGPQRPYLQRHIGNFMIGQGMKVTSGSLYKVLSLDLMIYPFRRASRRGAGLPVCILVEGQTHFFLNRNQSLLGDALFRQRMVRGLKASRLRAVLTMTLYEWWDADDDRSRLALIRRKFEEAGLAFADYLPPPKSPPPATPAAIAGGAGQASSKGRRGVARPPGGGSGVGVGAGVGPVHQQQQQQPPPQGKPRPPQQQGPPAAKVGGKGEGGASSSSLPVVTKPGGQVRSGSSKRPKGKWPRGKRRDGGGEGSGA